MATNRSKMPIGWAAAVAAVGATTLGIDLALRRQHRRWTTNPDPLDGRLPHFPPAEVHLVETGDGAEIHTLRAGHGPAVVLAHGLTASADDWGPVAERLLTAGLQVVAYDQRGHGYSTLGSAPFTPRRLADDLAQVIETLGLTDVVVAGHSMGGMAVAALAVHYPELLRRRVRGLALISTSGQLGRVRALMARPASAWLPLTVPDALSHSTPVLATAALSAFGPDPSLTLLQAAVASFRRCPPATLRQAAAGIAGVDLLGPLAEVRTPTVVVCGTHDVIIPFRHSEQLAATIPGARLVAVPEAGHLVIWEHPDEIARNLRDLAGPQSPPNRA